MQTERNVLGEALQVCGFEPETGFYRDGHCRTDAHDRGRHTVCARVTREFLEYSRQQGNDLVTPQPEYGFPGLRPGDRWCLCAARWKEALDAGAAPSVVLMATHEKTLEVVSLEDLKRYAIDLS
jgi:uncharacterized protein (DUF2237 family)